MHIFFSVGEPSGDEHTAGLIRAIKSRRPECRCVGFGGDDMAAAGCDILFPLTTMAVMGIVQVLPLLRKFWNLGQQAKRYFREQRPDAVVLVDFPGFNWWIAYYAKQAGIPVYYYLPPQLWAWGSWRVKRMHKYVDHVLTGLEFEAKWYRKQGVDAHFVGHPFFEEVAQRPISEQTIESLRAGAPQVIGLLPGSRKMEVQMNWPVMLEVVSRLAEQYPDCRFLVANYKPEHRKMCEEMLAEQKLKLPLEFHVRQTSAVIAAADFCFMVSGSVSLELLARKRPAVVLYKAGLVMGAIAKRVVTCKYMTLPNLISDRQLFPEFPITNQQQRHVESMSELLSRWLKDPEELVRVRHEISSLADEVAESQASQKTAAYLLRTLETSPLPASKAA